MPVDIDRVNKLLQAVEGVTKIAPGYTHIIGEAMAELREINEGIRKHKLVEQNKPVTPAPSGDYESPPPVGVNPEAAASGQIETKHPTASTPVKADVPKAPSPPPQPKPPLPSPTISPTRNVVDGLPGPAEPKD